MWWPLPIKLGRKSQNIRTNLSRNQMPHRFHQRNKEKRTSPFSPRRGILNILTTTPTGELFLLGTAAQAKQRACARMSRSQGKGQRRQQGLGCVGHGSAIELKCFHAAQTVLRCRRQRLASMASRMSRSCRKDQRRQQRFIAVACVRSVYIMSQVGMSRFLPSLRF